ncbi:hypothetical protein ATANTOWER_032868, partial [Ataeniobius toweri]|nr:hypothetical protein [Ataeniobius toweri]
MHLPACRTIFSVQRDPPCKLCLTIRHRQVIWEWWIKLHQKTEAHHLLQAVFGFLKLPVRWAELRAETRVITATPTALGSFREIRGGGAKLLVLIFPWQDRNLKRDKMVTKRIRSEYMKKFKDPQWETYTKCYEEMLAYRLTRRLLEHTHNPWFWSGSDSDSDSGGRSPPHPSENQVEASGGRAEAETEEAVGVKVVRHQEQETRTTGAGPGHTVENEVQIRPDPLSSAH